MKRLKREVYKGGFFLFFIPFSLFALLSFSLLDDLLLWMKLLSFLALVLLLSIYIYLHLMQKILSEIESLHYYITKISQKKEYSSIYKAKYFIEFLAISVEIKDIIKRVSNREKKKK